MSDGNRRYPLTYRIDPRPDKPTLDQVRADGLGACDAILLASIIRGSDGALSYAFPSLDGATSGPLSATDCFKVWVVLAHYLATDVQDLGDGRRTLALLVHRMVQAAIVDKPERLQILTEALKQAMAL